MRIAYQFGLSISLLPLILIIFFLFSGEIKYRSPLLLSDQIHLWSEYYRRYLSPCFPDYAWGDYADDGSIVAKE